MDLKNTKMKIVRTKDKIKTAIKENPDATLTIASQVIGFVALGMAYHTSNKLSEANRKLARERRNHAECHEFANWVDRWAKKNGRSEKTLKMDENGMITITDPEAETPED